MTWAVSAVRGTVATCRGQRSRKDGEVRKSWWAPRGVRGPAPRGAGAGPSPPAGTPRAFQTLVLSLWKLISHIGREGHFSVSTTFNFVTIAGG